MLFYKKPKKHLLFVSITSIKFRVCIHFFK